jgi:hypothetical protein
MIEISTLHKATVDNLPSTQHHQAGRPTTSRIQLRVKVTQVHPDIHLPASTLKMVATSVIGYLNLSSDLKAYIIPFQEPIKTELERMILHATSLVGKWVDLDTPNPDETN